MATRLNPYISFTDCTKAAMEFYRSVLGGDLVTHTFGNFGAAEGDTAELIMHAQLETASGFTLMASDTPPGMARTAGDNVTISLSGDDAEQLRGYWTGLAEGGNVSLPLDKQMWGDEFGMLTDKFGIPWMVNIAGEQASAD